MSRARMSALGLYKWDTSIFDNMLYPTALDKSILVNKILLDTAELSVIYTDPDFLKTAITLWSQTEIEIWEHLYETTQYEYNPIYNYDRYESTSTSTSESEYHSLSESNSNSTSLVHSMSDSTSLSSSEYFSESESASYSTSESQSILSAHKPFDTNSFNDNERNVTDKESANGNSLGRNHSGNNNQNSIEAMRDNTDGKGSDIRAHQSSDDRLLFTNTEHRAYGNIGVTTTQQMIEQERKIAEFNLYQYISESFKSHFCVMVY